MERRGRGRHCWVWFGLVWLQIRFLQKGWRERGEGILTGNESERTLKGKERKSRTEDTVLRTKERNQEGIQINRSIIHLEIVNTMARLIQGTRIVTDIINILEIRFQGVPVYHFKF